MLNSTGIAGIVAIEPSACPDAKGDMTPFTKIPILVLWGDYVNLSPRWSPRLAMCKAFAEAVTRAGGTIEHSCCPRSASCGNSHMLMQDRNKLEIADSLLAWIDRNVKTKTQR